MNFFKKIFYLIFVVIVLFVMQGCDTDAKNDTQSGVQKGAPVITLKGSNPMRLKIGDTYKDPGATAMDDEDGDLTSEIVTTGSVDTYKEGRYIVRYSVKDKSGNTTYEDRSVIVEQIMSNSSYSYIPKGKNLTYETAFRFLNLTTFGATPKAVKELQQKGVIGWLDEQLNIDYDTKKDSLVYLSYEEAKYINPKSMPETVEYYLDPNTDKSLPNDYSYPYNYRTYFFSNWVQNAVYSKSQLRMRVAYALSQIIVAADSNEIFEDRFNALAAYYDLLTKHAFDNYGDLLKDISVNPAMGYFLTFYGNRKKYKAKNGDWVYPDENYAREVMQLFSIGPILLNKDGTRQIQSSDSKNYVAATYTQQDVNEMARVFTGLDFRLRGSQFAKSAFGEGGTHRGSDLIHKMECFNDKYHDQGEKTILGHTISAGGDCYTDINSAIDILMQHPNTAPYLAKKLIMRLTKSNPKSDYVRRVAEVFEQSGGDLKEVIRAIYLDRELWVDNSGGNLQNGGSIKFKEPIMAFTQTLRVLNAKPAIGWRIEFNSGRGENIIKTITKPYFYVSNILSGSLGQAPAQAPSVFNFYNDTYSPNDIYFKVAGYAAPEVQIQVDKFFVAYHNFMGHLTYNETNYILNPYGVGPGRKVYKNLKDCANDMRQNIRIFIEMSKYYDIAKKVLGVSYNSQLDKNIKGMSEKNAKEIIARMVDTLDTDFLGGAMSDDMKGFLNKRFSKKLQNISRIDEFFYIIMQRMVHLIVTSDEYMVD